MRKTIGARARYMTAALVVTGGLGVAAFGCGDDDSTTSADSESTTESSTTEAASGDTVDVSTGEYFFELASDATPDTKSFSVTNEGKEFHVMILAKIAEGYTLEEAVKLEGKKGSAEVFAEAELPPGKTVDAELMQPLESGETYTMLCPVGGPDGPHYDLGQLEEIEVE
jgi:hypothetical protein